MPGRRRPSSASRKPRRRSSAAKKRSPKRKSALPARDARGRFVSAAALYEAPGVVEADGSLARLCVKGMGAPSHMDHSKSYLKAAKEAYMSNCGKGKAKAEERWRRVHGMLPKTQPCTAFPLQTSQNKKNALMGEFMAASRASCRK